MLNLVTLNVIGWTACYLADKKIKKDMQEILGNSDEMIVVDKDGTEIKIKKKNIKQKKTK